MKKMNFPDTAGALEEYHNLQSAKYKHHKHEVIIESVAYQAAMEQYLKKNSKMAII